MWDYEGLVKRLIHNVKYGGLTHIIDECVESSFKLIARDINRFYSFLSFLSSNDTYITYVPMYIKRKKRRGFNQSEIIARELAKKVEVRPLHLLEKVVDTEDEAKLSKEERLENIKGSFVLNSNVEGVESVLLIDDVFITGATMRECCKTLKQSGVKKVWAFTLARVP
jgi:competence protein ComFC